MPPQEPKNTKPLTYTDAGVSLEAGDRVVGLIKSHLRRTHGPRVLGRHGAFAGMFRLDFNEKLFKRNYRDPVLVGCADGVGTKVKLAVQMGVHDTIGRDCVAMNVNDMVVQGAEPLFFLDYIGIHRVIPQQTEQIIKGVADGCELAGCALLGGETAEMPDIYREGEYDLAGFAVGVCEMRRIVDDRRCEVGDVILGLAASGVHSNGYTLVRAIVRQAKLDLDNAYPEVDQQCTLGQVLLEPTRIYVKPLVNVLHYYRVKKPIPGMAHITGGGLVGNVARTLGHHLNAKINLTSWAIPPVFRFLQQHGNVTDEQMFGVFNMGIGYVMIVRPHFAESIRAQLKRLGEQVFILGKVVRGTGRVVLGAGDCVSGEK